MHFTIKSRFCLWVLIFGIAEKVSIGVNGQRESSKPRTATPTLCEAWITKTEICDVKLIIDKCYIIIIFKDAIVLRNG
jgi:hypothetical protein